MRILLFGGSGQVGQILLRHFQSRGDEVTVIGRGAPQTDGQLQWDGKSLGDWQSAVEGVDVVINLAGRSVNCRYTETNLQQMMDSRVDSTRVVGEAISAAASPPRLWLQMSTATIYAHRFDAGNDEETGVIGGSESNVPAYWKRSIDIALAWEKALAEAVTPNTRKVAMRAAMIMSADNDGIFDVLCGMVQKRLGGSIAGGKQYVSWMHAEDLCRAIDYLIEHEEMSGPINLAAPNPLPQRDFMAALRNACGVGLGLPATGWMARIGAVFMRSDVELLLKSRRVVPGALLSSGFQFSHPTWPEAASDLLQRRLSTELEESQIG